MTLGENMDLYEQIWSLLESHGNLGIRDKGKDLNYVHESNLDSFALLNFIAEVEEAFGVQFTPKELAYNETHTVEGLTRLIVSKRKESG